MAARRRSSSAGVAARVAAAIALVLAVAPGAQAQPGARAASKLGPCRAEAQRLCPDATAAGGRGALRCLYAQREKLSPACRQHVEAHHARMQARAQEIEAACAQDHARWCKDVDWGKGGVVRCLRDHAADLAPACREAIGRRPGPPPS
jgi:hypothetical protein